MEALDELVRGGREVGERDPRVLVGREVGPVREVFVTLANLATIKDRMNGRGRNFVDDFEGSRSDRRRCGGRIVIRFEERCVENGMKAGKV